MTDRKAGIPISYGAELATAVEEDQYPKTDYSQIGFRGDLDIEKFVEAFDEVIPEWDVVHCRLEDRRIGLRHQLYWVQKGETPKLHVEDCRDRVQQPADPIEFIQEYHSEIIKRRIDLFNEPPIRFFLLRIADDRYLFSMVFHHIAVDAGTGYLHMRHMFAKYHEKVTGERPEWADGATISSSGRKVEDAKPQPLGKFLRDQVMDLFFQKKSAITKIATSSDRPVLGRRLHRTIVSDEAKRGIKSLAKRNGATFGDVLNASITRSIAAWDRERGQGGKKVRALLAVNVRNRISSVKNADMALSGLNITLAGADRMDIDDVVRHFRDERTRQLDEGVDVALFKMLEFVAKSGQNLPLNLRGPFMRKLISAPVTYILSNIGVMWPGVENGRPTGRSAFTVMGGVEIDDVHSCPSMALDVGMGVIARTLGDKLFINCTCDRWHFTKDEAKAVTDRVFEGLESLAQYAQEKSAEAV